MTYTLASIASKINAQLVIPASDGVNIINQVEIFGLATLANAGKGQIAF